MPTFKGSKDEAQFIMRLVRAWQGTQAIQDALRPILTDFKLLKPNDNLDIDMTVALAQALK